jgi:hypothetical protein
LNRQATLWPDAEMIDVEALIRQIVPKAILAHGINGAVLARRSGSFSLV